MIAVPKQETNPSTAEHWHAKFLELLPQIRSQARCAFRHESPEQHEELITEVVANSWVAFVRLMERGRDDAVFATPLAQYAIRQTRAGRRVGRQLNVKDVTSRHCQVATGVRVEQLDLRGDDSDEWQEVVVEDRHAGPAEVASTRIDFGDWLRFLPSRHRRIAKVLATGESTGRTARRFRISSSRVSQIRAELRRLWLEFHGEVDGITVAAT